MKNILTNSSARKTLLLSLASVLVTIGGAMTVRHQVNEINEGFKDVEAGYSQLEKIKESRHSQDKKWEQYKSCVAEGTSYTFDVERCSKTFNESVLGKKDQSFASHSKLDYRNKGPTT